MGLSAPIAVSVETEFGPVLYTERDEIVVPHPDLSDLPGFGPRRVWADSWPLEEVLITVLVEAAVARTVILRNLRVIIDERRQPPEANLAVPAGVLPTRTFVIDLDQDDPRIVRDTGTPAFPYTVSQTDPERFVIMATTRRYYVEWRLALDWTCLGQQGTEIIDMHGQPFRVSAAPESLRLERARRQE